MKAHLNCRECGGSFKVSRFPPKPECPLCGAGLEGHYSCEPCGKKFTRESLDVYSDKKPITRDQAVQNLLKIPGVGPLKAQALYDAGFQTIIQIHEASVEDLSLVPKIGKKSSQKIKKALESEDIRKLEEMEASESLVEEEMECPVCSTILSVYDTACYECGYAFQKKKSVSEDLKALAVYDRKLQSNPSDPDLLFAKGATLSRIGRNEEAVECYEKVGETNPQFEGLWNAMAEAYTSIGEHEKAADCYKKSMEGVLGDILGSSTGQEEIPDEEEDLLDMLLDMGKEEDVAEEDIFFDAPPTPTTMDIEEPEDIEVGEIDDMLEDLLDGLMEESIVDTEEAPEEFSCPLCNTTVSIDATECPNCHATFAGAEDVAEEDILLGLEEILEDMGEESFEEEPAADLVEEPYEEPYEEAYEEAVVSYIPETIEETVEPAVLMDEPTVDEGPASASEGFSPDMMIKQIVNTSETKWFVPAVAVLVVAFLILGVFLSYPGFAGAAGETIQLDGRLDDWPGDSIQTVADGGTSPGVDISRCGVYVGDNWLYGFVETRAAPFSGPGEIRWFIDSDNSDSTGYRIYGMGADYMITANGNGGLGTVTISRFMGRDQNNWGGWVVLEDARAAHSGRVVEFAVPLNWVGLESGSSPRSVFTSASSTEIDHSTIIGDTSLPTPIVHGVGPTEIVDYNSSITAGRLLSNIETNGNIFSSSPVPVAQGTTVGTRMVLYISTDPETGHAVGNINADYKIEIWGMEGNILKTTVHIFPGQHYTGPESGWPAVGSATASYQEAEMSVSVALSTIGASPGDNISLLWLLEGQAGGDVSSIH